MEIKIAMACNDGYARHTGCLMESIIQNAEDSETFVFYIVDGGISEENKRKLECVGNRSCSELHFLTPDFKKIAGLPELGYLSLSTYMRLFLADLLENVDRLIYLDSDIIVMTSLSELWNSSLEGKSLGVVPDYVNYSEKLDPGVANLAMGTPMFNAGVMLMDLGKIRREGTFKKCFEWLWNPNSSIRNADQDALNLVFQHDKVWLPCRWNIQVTGESKWKVRPYDKLPDVQDAIQKECCIFHFLGPKKPWLSSNEEPWKKFYWKMLRQTPWKDEKMPRLPFKESVRRYLRNNRLNHKFREFCKRLKLWIRGEKTRPLQ